MLHNCSVSYGLERVRGYYNRGVAVEASWLLCTAREVGAYCGDRKIQEEKRRDLLRLIVVRKGDS